MFGELLAAALPVDLEATFGEVGCPAGIVAVTIANTGASDERYALRVAGRVQRTELVPARTTVVSRVRLPEDRPTTIAVHTEKASVASASRTADCVRDGGASAVPEPKGGGTAPAASSSPAAAPAPAVSEEGARRRAESGPSVPSWSQVPGLAPPPPKGGDPRDAEGASSGAPAAASEDAVAGGTREAARKRNAAQERKAKKAKKRRETEARNTRRREWRRTQPQTLPMTGISPAFGYTGLGTAVTGGILAWYGLLWPRRRTGAFPSRERSQP